jgi:sulfatase maturation enzyme AslB (radical SAM superfamily)
MPDQQIFCNTPWYELHIYWDGSLGICCQESRKLYAETDQQYNIATMTIADWFNSDPVKKFRLSMLGDQRMPECRQCYLEENHGGNSRRLRSNQKSVIFTKTAFERSFEQSPGHVHFVKSAERNGSTGTHPVDIHIDLGNYCNLACKMCTPKASSTIASQQVRWGIESSRQYLGTDWTRNNKVWNRFKQDLLALPRLNNIHFMGGETLLTDRFENLVDTMIEHRRFDLCFSFVTNGTTFNDKILDKLKLFRRVGIEISIETVDEHNAYQRQGTNTQQVLDNIQRYLSYCNGSSVTVALRPAVSLLTIGYYIGVLEYALEHRLVVKSNLCYLPKFLNAEMLPTPVKLLYQKKYCEFLNKFSDISSDSDYNASNPNNYKLIIKEQVNMCLAILQTPTPNDSDIQMKNLVEHCRKWDTVYGYDARKLYPELIDILDQYEY